MNRTFITAAALLLGSGSVTACRGLAQDVQKLRFEGATVEVPIPLVDGRHLAQVHIGDAGPFSFIIDTGSTASAVDTRLADSLGLRVIGETPVGAPGGSRVVADRVAVPSLSVGSLRIDNAQMVAIELDSMTGGLMLGILGMDVFRDVLLTLDPVNERALVSRAKLSADDPDVIKMDADTGGVNIPISVAGRTILAHLDSGSPGGVTLPIGMMEDLRFTTTPERTGQAQLVGSTRALTIRQLDGLVTIGALKYENPIVTFMDPAPPYANVGSEILSDLVITIDQGSRLVTMHNPVRQVESKSTSEGPRRLGVRFRGVPGGGLSEIADVDSGSLGEQVGFSSGDRILSLNGQPISDFDQRALGSLIRGATPLTWLVERDGEQITIVVP